MEDINIQKELLDISNQLDMEMNAEMDAERIAKHVRQKAKKALDLAKLLFSDAKGGTDKVPDQILEAQANDFMKLSEQHLHDAIDRVCEFKDYDIEFEPFRQPKQEPQEVEYDYSTPKYVEAIKRLNKLANRLDNQERTHLAFQVRNVIEKIKNGMDGI